MSSLVAAEEKKFLKGQWVKVWALVVETDPHPEEIIVRLASHSEHYRGLVRRDMVEIVPEDTPRPHFISGCRAMRVALDEPNTYRRCVLADEHPGPHTGANDSIWDDTKNSGYFEEA